MRFMKIPLIAAIAFSLSLPVFATTGTTADTVPKEIREGLEAALQDRIAELFEEKDDEGRSYKRGSFAKKFRKLGDGNYQATMHVDTAGPTRMRTERFLVTLERDPERTDAWKITDESLQDTFDELYRSGLGESTLHTFDSFSLDREGLTVRSGRGSLYTVKRNEGTVYIVAVADDIDYDYTPPVKRYVPLYEKLEDEHADDVLFDPERMIVSCDPVSCEDLLGRFENLAPAGREDVDDELGKLHDDGYEQYEKALEKNYFTGFFLPYEPDRRYWSLQLAKGSRLKVAMRFDNLAGKEIAWSVYGLFETFPNWSTVYQYHSEEQRETVDPIVLERRDDANRRDYDLRAIRGNIDLALKDDETMEADLEFDLRLKRPRRHIPFFVSRLATNRPDQKEAKNPKLFVNSIQDGAGNDLTYVKLGSNYALIVLPEELPAGSEITLRAQFENRAAIYKLHGTYSYLSRGGWLPFVNFGDMIHEMDFTVRVPEKYQTLGIGRMVSEEVDDGVRTTRWKPEFPVEFPTVIFGDYLTVDSRVEAKKLDGTPVPVRIHVDRVSLADWEIQRQGMLALADDAANSINLFQAIFGVDYPYAKLDLVNDPQGFLYGQAPSSIVYLGSGAFSGKGALGSLGGSSLSVFARALVAHEVAHQWWGSVVANANQRNYWFVESLASYSAALFLENAYGEKDYHDFVRDWRRNVLNTGSVSSVQDATHMWGGDLGGYQTNVYSKGPYAFHVLRSTLGDPKFFAMIRVMARELAGREIVTRDIQRALEVSCSEIEGRPCEYDLEGFFDQWIRSPGMPEFEFEFATRETEDGQFLVRGEVRQKVVVGRSRTVIEDEFFKGVLPVTVKLKNGKEVTVRIPLKAQAVTPFQFKLPEEPKSLEPNKYGEVLAWEVDTKKS